MCGGVIVVVCRVMVCCVLRCTLVYVCCDVCVCVLYCIGMRINLVSLCWHCINHGNVSSCIVVVMLLRFVLVCFVLCLCCLWIVAFVLFLALCVLF